MGGVFGLRRHPNQNPVVPARFAGPEVRRDRKLLAYFQLGDVRRREICAQAHVFQAAYLVERLGEGGNLVRLRIFHEHRPRNGV